MLPCFFLWFKHLETACSSGLYVSLIRKNQGDKTRPTFPHSRDKPCLLCNAGSLEEREPLAPIPLCAFPLASLVSSHMCDWPSPGFRRSPNSSYMDFPRLRAVLACREVEETLPGPLQMHRLANPPGTIGVLIISSQPCVIVHP